MKSLDTLFKEYSADHQNELNQKIHYICVPVIVYSVMGLLWALPLPTIGTFTPNLAWFFAAGSLVYYFLLSPKLATTMLFFTALCFASFYGLKNLGVSVAWTSGLLFVLAWVGQFYGHKVEGKKPSFFTDLTYLFVGPLWVLKKMISQ